MTKGSKSSFVNKAIQDEELKTVILVSGLNDDYLKPISNYLPECLLSIGSIPIIHYQISYLIQENFQRIIIYALSSSKLIRKYCQAHYGNLKIEVQNGSKSHNFGDIMRDLDSNQSIRNLQDFVIMPIDLLLSSSLMKMYQEHLERRELVNSCVMTFGMVKSTQDLFLQSDQIRGICIKASASNKLMAFDRYATPKCPKESHIESFVEDVHLVICTKHIPPLFQDNFDYANFEDLIHGILINEEIIQYTMHVDFLPSSHIHLRVATDFPRLFDASKIILDRNLLPFHDIPPNYLPTLLQNYRLYKGMPNVYVSQSAKIHPSVKFIGSCMIGTNVKIGAGSIIIDCIIGNNCSIGDQARLRKVIAMSDVTICDHVRMDVAMIFDNAQILSRSKFERNVVIAPSLIFDTTTAMNEKNDAKSEYQRSMYYIQSPGMITIGPDAKIPSKSVIVAPDENHPMADSSIMGKSAWASLYSLKNDPDSSDDDSDLSSDSDDEEQAEKSVDDRIQPWTTVFEVSKKLGRSYMNKKISCSKSEEDPDNRHKSLSRQSITPLTPGPASADKAEEFLIEELRNTLDRCLTERIDPKNITLEINSLKHAYAILIDDLFFLLTQAMLQTCLDRVVKSKGLSNPDDVQVMDFAKEFKGAVTFLKPMLETYFVDADDAQEICLSAIEDLATTQNVILKSGQYIIHILYDADVLGEEIIFDWNKSSDLLEDSDTADKAREFRKYVDPFIKWLQEASEDGSSEEEEEDSE